MLRPEIEECSSSDASDPRQAAPGSAANSSGQTLDKTSSPSPPYPPPATSQPGSSAACFQVFPKAPPFPNDSFSLTRITESRGGFTLWQCEDTRTGEHFSCRVIPKHALQDSAAQHQLRVHADILFAVAGQHPNIVTLHYIFEDSAYVYMVMEPCNAGTLTTHLEASQAQLSEEEAAYIFQQVVSALRFCHLRNIIHRDIQPKNILLAYPTASVKAASSGGGASVQGALQVKLAGFDLAMKTSPGGRITGRSGRLASQAPEVLFGQPNGPKADVWALGVLLYELVAGCLPVDDSENEAALGEQLKKGVDLSRSASVALSAELQSLLHGMLALEEEKRLTASEASRHPWLVERVQRGSSVGYADREGHSREGRPQTDPLVQPGVQPSSPSSLAYRGTPLQRLRRGIVRTLSRDVAAAGSGNQEAELPGPSGNVWRRSYHGPASGDSNLQEGASPARWPLSSSMAISSKLEQVNTVPGKVSSFLLNSWPVRKRVTETQKSDRAGQRQTASLKNNNDPS